MRILEDTILTYVIEISSPLSSIQSAPFEVEGIGSSGATKLVIN